MMEEYRTGNEIFVIVTYGEENSNREYSVQKIRAMIKEEKTYGWEFVFLGANIDEMGTAGRGCISADWAVDYVSNSTGTELNF